MNCTSIELYTDPVVTCQLVVEFFLYWHHQVLPCQQVFGPYYSLLWHLRHITVIFQHILLSNYDRHHVRGYVHTMC